jgi:hypothetical protein
MRSPFFRFMKFTSVLSLSLPHGFNIVFVSFLGEKMKFKISAYFYEKLTNSNPS